MDVMVKKLLFIFLFCVTLSISGQYTNVINSNRPGLSESPYSVGLGVYQLESTLFFKRIPVTETFSNPASTGINLLFRTSFLSERIEFNLNILVIPREITVQNKILVIPNKSTQQNIFILGHSK